MIGIYKITNPKGKIYIGQSINIKKRFSNYKCLSCKDQPILYHSLQKHGVENHSYEIIEECTIEQLNEREVYWKQYYIDQLGSNNILFCGLHDEGTGPRSDETKQKISQANKGKPKPKGFGVIVSISNIGISRNKGKKLSEEHKLKLSNSIKGKKSNYKMERLDISLNEIKKDYEILPFNILYKKYNVSHYTMRNFLKKNNIFEFRKNYRK